MITPSASASSLRMMLRRISSSGSAAFTSTWSLDDAFTKLDSIQDLLWCFHAWASSLYTVSHEVLIANRSTAMLNAALGGMLRQWSQCRGI